MQDNLEKTTPFFTRYRGKPSDIYSSEEDLLRILGKQATYQAANLRDSKITKREFDNAFTNPTLLAKRSMALYASDSNYAAIIDYYKDMYMYFYKVVPVKMTKFVADEVSPEEYAEIYTKMLSIIDGISISTIFPSIVKDILMKGSVALYADKDNSTETVSTILLPMEYTRAGLKTQYGINSVLFDFKYFDDIKNKITKSENADNSITFETLFDLFPKEFAQKYRAYEGDKNLRWQQLDARFSAYFQLNEYGIPPKISVNDSAIDYAQVKENEIVRSNNELETLFVQQIPNYEGQMMFDIPEARDLHKSLVKSLSTVDRLKVLTTFGPVELLNLQDQRTAQDSSREEAYKGMFFDAAVNPNVFLGVNAESLQIGLDKDMSFVKGIIDSIMMFYNVAVNNLYNFKPFQAAISMLPVTVYNINQKLDDYRESATLGVAKLDMIIASGVKQSEIQDNAKLEQYLELDKILVPLQSSYTQSGKQAQEEKQANDDSKPVEEKQPAKETPPDEAEET